ncbi:MAG TPA: hypothetical protein VLF91_05860 [Candidatus Saccharimonadales bacterium]|nr:hypothetical protein [Candidatus Saccharimonadales bacterium]
MATEQEPDLEPLLGVQQNRLGQVLSDGDSIDSKALAILGANIAILIFIDQAGLHNPLWQLVAVCAPLLLSLLLDFVAIWPQKYLTAVTLSEAPSYLAMDRPTLVLQLLADTAAAISHNEQVNRRRLRACLSSIVLTALGFLLLLVIL